MFRISLKNDFKAFGQGFQKEEKGKGRKKLKREGKRKKKGREKVNKGREKVMVNKGIVKGNNKIGKRGEWNESW